MVNREVSLIEY